MPDYFVPAWLKDYHTCTGKRSTGSKCVFRGIEKIDNAWFCKIHAKKKRRGLEERVPLKMINKIRLTVGLHERQALPPETDYKSLWEAMVPALLKEVLRLRGIK